MDTKERVLFTAKRLSVLILTAVIVLAGDSALAADTPDFTINNLGYKITVQPQNGKNGEVTLVDGQSAAGSVTIPKDVKDPADGTKTYDVTVIGERAFQRNGNIQSLSFEENSPLKHINFYAFQFCSSLTGELKIPATVETINSFAFDGLSITKLTFMGADDGTSKLKYIGERAFNGCWMVTGELKIPATVTTIKYQAFYQTGITGLTFGANSRLEVIGGSAFASCSGLTGHIKIPATVTAIGDSAFNDTAITELTFMGAEDGTSSLTIIRRGAFGGCDSLTGQVKIPEGVTTIDEFSFEGSGITKVIIPDSVNELFLRAFEKTNLGTVVFKGAPPSSIRKFVFRDVKGTLVIKVPKEHEAAYKAAFPDYADSIQGVLPETYNAFTVPGRESFTEGQALADGLIITCDGDFDLFMGLDINGERVDKANYTKKSGSTVVILSQSYLNTLKAGVYNVKLLYDYGSAQASFTVMAPPTTTAPPVNPPVTAATTTATTTATTVSAQTDETTAAVTAVPADVSPKTSDRTAIVILLTAMAGALIALGALAVEKKS